MEAPPIIRVEDYDSLDVVLDTVGRTSNKQQWIDMTLSGAIEDVVGYSLLWFRAPFAFDVIDSGNNEFIFTTGATDYLCRLQIGCYNATNIQNVMQTALYLGGVPNAQTYQVFVGLVDTQLVIWHPTQTFSVRWGNKVQSRLFGFGGFFNAGSVNGVTYSDQGALLNGGNPVNYIKSPDVVDLININVLKFWSSLQNDTPSSRDLRSDQSLTAIIPVTSNYGDIINYRHKVQLLPISVPQTVTSMRVQVSAGDDRESTYYDTESGQLVKTNFLPLGGLGFQFGVRFYMRNKSQN